MVCVDVYVNETTRHADVILPAPSPLRRGHYDLALYQFAVRNVANYSPPVLAPEPELPDEWVTLLRLSGDRLGTARTPTSPRSTTVSPGRWSSASSTPRLAGGRAHADEMLDALEPARGPERMLDLMLRAGPYGDGFGARTDGRLTLATLEAAPHGIDLGPLTAAAARALRTAERARSSWRPS